MSDLLRNVGDVLSRADTLFGTADPEAAATAADRLVDATDAIRTGQEQAADLTGDAVTNYAEFAQGHPRCARPPVRRRGRPRPSAA